MITKQKIKNIIIILTVMIILAITCVFYSNFNNFIYNFTFNHFNIVTKENNLLVHFIDVGQGDAIAINLPSGKTLLIDTGPQDSSIEYTNYLKEKVLNNSLSNKIDYLILTHADEDHIGGTLKLLQKFEVGKVYLPVLGGDTETYTEIEDFVLKNCNYEYLSSDTSLCDTECDLYILGSFNRVKENDTCPVIKIEYMDKSFLFAGDISRDVEEELIEQNKDLLDCDVLKVAHHGSGESTCDAFLEAVTPEYSVISVGKNFYGHPTEEVIERLIENSSNIIRTDKKGSVIFAVGKYYELNYMCEDYYITNLTFDFRVCILMLEIVLIIVIGIVVFKKSKQREVNK